ncbi:MAG: hypothetical protein K5877_09860, partial [Lachnospiraceae bacterium]|nr:hypothetical protein [Lachnospiraceae bacterium]
MKIRRLLASIMAAMMILTVFPQDFYVFAAQTEDTALVEETVDTQTVEDELSEETADEAVTDDSDKEVSDESADIEAEETDKDTEDSSDTVSENSTDEKTVSGNDANEDVADIGNVGEEVLMSADVSDMLYQNGALSISEDALGTKLGTQKYREVCNYLYKELLQKKASIDISKYNISTDDIKNVYFGTINEHGDLYFARDGSFQYYSSGNKVTTLEPQYPNGTFDDEAFKKAADRALQVIEPDMTDLEKALALHDYIDVNTVYQIGAPNQYNTYGILVGQRGVCNGYALTYKYLLSLVGIDSVFISSAQLNHAWNAIEINGKYYLVDATWDDP